MVSNMKYNLTLDENDDDDADFRYNFRDTMIAQIKIDLKNKNFSLQDQGKCDQIDTHHKSIEFWPNVSEGVSKT